MGFFNIGPYIGSILREFDSPDEKIAAKLFSEKSQEHQYPFADQINDLVNFLYFGGKEVENPSNFLKLIFNCHAYGFETLNEIGSPAFYFNNNKYILPIFIDVFDKSIKNAAKNKDKIQSNIKKLVKFQEDKNYRKIFITVNKNGKLLIGFTEDLFFPEIDWAEFSINYKWIILLCVCSILLWRYNKIKKPLSSRYFYDHYNDNLFREL